MIRKSSFFLDCDFNGKKTHVKIEDDFLIGSSKKANLKVKSPKLEERHFIFRIKDGVLSVQFNGNYEETTIQGKKLQKGKMVILDDNDEILHPDFSIKISKENETEEEDDLGTLNLSLETDSPFSNDLEETILKENEKAEIDRKRKEEDRKNGKADNDGNTKKSLDELLKEQNSDDLSEGQKTHLTNLKSLFKGSRDQRKTLKAKNKGKKSSIEIGDAPGIVTRLLSLFLEIILAIELFSNFNLVPKKIQDHFFLISKHGFKYFNDYGLKYIKPLIKEHLAEYLTYIEKYVTQEYFNYFVLVIIIQLVSSMIFGASIFMFFMGIKDPHSGFLSKRIKGIIRTLIGVISLPFLIFDIPCLVRKRTLKEVLSGSYLTYTFSKNRILFQYVVLPLLILLGWGFYLVTQDFSFSRKIDRNFSLIVHKNKSDEKGQLIHTKSSALSFKFDTHIPMKYLILPYFELNTLQAVVKGKFQNENFSILGLKLWNEEEKSSLDFGIVDKISIKNILNYLTEKNFFFKFMNPKITAVLNEKDKKISEIEEEIYDLLLITLTHSLENPYQLVLSQGPLLINYLHLKNILLSNLEIFGDYSFSFESYNKNKWIILTDQSSPTLNRTFFLGIFDEEINIYYFKNKKKEEKIAKTLISSIFGGVEKGKFSLSEDSTPLALVDAYGEVLSGKKIPSQSLNKVFSYLEQLIEEKKKMIDITAMRHIEYSLSNSLVDIKKLVNPKEVKLNQEFINRMNQKSVQLINEMKIE